MNPSTTHQTASVLASLRRLIPPRPVTFAEALRIAELQANRLRDLTANDADVLSEEALAGLPRIRVVRRRLPTSGLSYWDGSQWVIALNRTEPLTRQRFTLLHEYKHIIDHGHADWLYAGTRRHSPSEQGEQAADYFAGCALMPKRLVKRAWGNGTQTAAKVGRRFDVSERAAEVRLAQLGLPMPKERCAGPRYAQLHYGPASRRTATERTAA